MMNALHVVLFSVAALLGLGVLVHSKQIMGGQYYEQQPVMHQQVGYGVDAGYGYGGDMGGYVMMPAGYGYGHGGGGVSLSLGGGGLGGSMWLWIIVILAIFLIFFMDDDSESESESEER